MMSFLKQLGADLMALLLWPQRFLNKWLNVRTSWWALPLLILWWGWLLAGTLTAGCWCVLLCANFSRW